MWFYNQQSRESRKYQPHHITHQFWKKLLSSWNFRTRHLQRVEVPHWWENGKPQTGRFCLVSLFMSCFDATSSPYWCTEDVVLEWRTFTARWASSDTRLCPNSSCSLRVTSWTPFQWKCSPRCLEDSTTSTSSPRTEPWLFLAHHSAKLSITADSWPSLTAVQYLQCRGHLLQVAMWKRTKIEMFHLELLCSCSSKAQTGLSGSHDPGSPGVHHLKLSTKKKSHMVLKNQGQSKIFTVLPGLSRWEWAFCSRSSDELQVWDLSSVESEEVFSGTGTRQVHEEHGFLTWNWRAEAWRLIQFWRCLRIAWWECRLRGWS